MATAVASSDATDGPVLSLINKRLRALRKKHNRIIQMEESVSHGKTLNKEQEETLRSKPHVVAAIDELEKLRQPLSVAVSEEIDLALKSRGGVDDKPNACTSEEQPSNCNSSSGDNVTEGEVPAKERGELDGRNDRFAVVEDLLNLLYFGSMFDVKNQNDFTATMLTRTHERGCCLTYDYVTDDDAADLLGERDLDLISMLGGLLMSRPVNSSLSHKNALQSCVEHARLWLSNSDQLVGPASDITYAGLREKLNKIMASDYFTATPEMRAPVEVAAAAGNYGSFQVPVHENMLPADIPGVEGSMLPYELSEQVTAGAVDNGTYDSPSDPVSDFQQVNCFHSPKFLVHSISVS
ncbi:OLC1v1028070C1 [Oldenlandia corymbosa var. corymbosa]|uniref:OLC1v1028070C1 n=1 Tax=Oldenlandia corymbosa var. corymbosa TaxID=529605 RepID=A0AAV1CCX1_OLDCO|nr:OLC1v1028070C1 [Oldenlandia corymbosa var. corymbosa]